MQVLATPQETTIKSKMCVPQFVCWSILLDSGVRSCFLFHNLHFALIAHVSHVCLALGSSRGDRGIIMHVPARACDVLIVGHCDVL